jgi:hypothetical protein
MRIHSRIQMDSAGEMNAYVGDRLRPSFRQSLYFMSEINDHISMKCEAVMYDKWYYDGEGYFAFLPFQHNPYITLISNRILLGFIKGR